MGITDKMAMSKTVQYFEKAFDRLNEHYFESALSKSVITVQSTPKFNGHFTTEKVWQGQNSSRYEINMGAEAIRRPIHETVATLLHEMVHQYCQESNIKDTSRTGTYHNKSFKLEVEKRGLSISYDKKIGWSLTEPTPELMEFITSSKLDSEIQVYRKTVESAHSKSKKKSSTRKYVCPCCGQSIRATKEVHVKCADCDELMTIDGESGDGDDE